MLKFPFEDKYGLIIADASDLEIGQIVHCARKSRVKGKVRQTLELLARMRRSLAHVEPVTADDLREAADLPVTDDG